MNAPSMLRWFARLLISLSAPAASAQEWEWAHSAGGSGGATARAIAVDAGGNAYVTGDFTGTAAFGNMTLTNVDLGDVFVAKLSVPMVASEGEPTSTEGSLHLSSLWPNPATTRATATLTARAGQERVRAEVLDALGRRPCRSRGRWRRGCL